MEAQNSLILRYMTNPDIQQVVVIDAASFNPPWSERSYKFEINESHVSHMCVLERQDQRPVQGLRRLLHGLLGQEAAYDERKLIVGYGGLWKIADEAHISTIASHPDYRGNKYGEIVLVGMMHRAIHLEAGYIILEVRVSNHIAQNLYHKYGFTTVNLKKEYYHHDREDAYEMRFDITPNTVSRFQEQVQALLAHVSYRDRYATMPHPRLEI